MPAAALPELGTDAPGEGEGGRGPPRSGGSGSGGGSRTHGVAEQGGGEGEHDEGDGGGDEGSGGATTGAGAGHLWRGRVLRGRVRGGAGGRFRRGRFRVRFRRGRHGRHRRGRGRSAAGAVRLRPGRLQGPPFLLVRPAQQGEAVDHGELLRDGRARAVAVEGGRADAQPPAQRLVTSPVPRLQRAHEPRELLDGGVLRHSIPLGPASHPSRPCTSAGVEWVRDGWWARDRCSRRAPAPRWLSTDRTNDPTGVPPP